MRLQGRTKKDAKQRAASQILEAVLTRMSLQDFLKAPVINGAMPPSLAESVLAHCMPAAMGGFNPSRLRPQVREAPPKAGLDPGLARLPPHWSCMQAGRQGNRCVEQGRTAGEAAGAGTAGISRAGQAAGHAMPATGAAAQRTAMGAAGTAQGDSTMAEELPATRAATSGASLLQATRVAVQEAPVVAGRAAEDGFPRCKHLIEAYHELPNSQNKTPLAVLHDYATRLGLEVRRMLQAPLATSAPHVCFGVRFTTRTPTMAGCPPLCVVPQQ